MNHMRQGYSLIIMLLLIMASCGGTSSNIYILADTSMPDESVEEEFCRKTNTDNYPIVNLDEKEK